MESELLLFLSQSADAFVMYNSNLQYTYINKTGAAFLGLTPEEIVGKTNRDIIGQEADILELYVQAAFDGKEKVFVVHEIPLPLGTRWFDTIYTPVFNEKQEIVRVVGVCRDVTGNKMRVEQLENMVKERTEGLRQSEALYRNLIETTAAVAWEVDLISKRFTFISPQIRDLSGFPPEDWVDFDFWAEHVHPEDRERVVSYCQEDTAKGLDHAFEYRMLTADERIVWVRDCVSVITEEDKPRALRGFFIDITEHKLAEKERQKLELQIQQAQKLESLGALAGGIAHDFNNILTGILGSADLALIDLPSSSSANSLIREILKAGHRASDLTNQMLAYSGQGRFVIEYVDLSAIIKDMSSLLESSVTGRNTLQFKLDDDLPAIEADVTQLQQITLNLVSNAAEASGERGGRVTVITRAGKCDEKHSQIYPSDSPLRSGDPCVVLEVSDTGCGMNTDIKGQIFDPFFTSKFTGRGLGLAAVLGIVRSHRGGIIVESKLGRGTTFTIMFPALNLPIKLAKNIQEEQTAAQSTGTILLVDDEEAIRSVTGRILERLGYNVLVAEDGVEALEIFQSHQDEIACVLLDLTMPNMDGKETFTELKKIKSDVQVILSSGYSKHELKKSFKDSGLAGFIQKPYTIALLRKHLTEVLGAG